MFLLHALVKKNRAIIPYKGLCVQKPHQPGSQVSRCREMRGEFGACGWTKAGRGPAAQGPLRPPPPEQLGALDGEGRVSTGSPEGSPARDENAGHPPSGRGRGLCPHVQHPGRCGVLWEQLRPPLLAHGSCTQALPGAPTEGFQAGVEEGPAGNTDTPGGTRSPVLPANPRPHFRGLPRGLPRSLGGAACSELENRGLALVARGLCR